MAYIFLDESGDLGSDFTKDKTSKHFVISFLFINSRKTLEKIVKRTFQSFTPKVLKKHSGVLHCYKENHAVKSKLLSLLMEKEDAKIMTIYLDKRTANKSLYDDKHILYNNIVQVLLEEVCQLQIVPRGGTITLVASKRETNKFLNDKFKEYLRNSHKEIHEFNLEVEIKTPSEDKGVQVADFVCWSIFRKKEKEDSIYYDLIKDKIIKEVKVGSLK